LLSPVKPSLTLLRQMGYSRENQQYFVNSFAKT
jgi:hypothetical protein